VIQFGKFQDHQRQKSEANSCMVGFPPAIGWSLLAFVGTNPMDELITSGLSNFPQRDLSRIHRSRQRPPSNGSIERAQSTSSDFTLS